MIEQARLNDPALQGIRVLIVDDDVRNVFALTAALEQRFGMQRHLRRQRRGRHREARSRRARSTWSSWT